MTLVNSGSRIVITYAAYPSEYKVVACVPLAFTTYLPLIFNSGSPALTLPLSDITQRAYQFQDFSTPPGY